MNTGAAQHDPQPRRILFFSPVPLLRELGAGKVLIELAAAMRQIGWSCELIQAGDLRGTAANGVEGRWQLMQRLREYLLKHAAEYDVIDYDHEYLPFPRDFFVPAALMVARSVLLVQHLRHIKLPEPRGLRPAIGRLLYGRKRRDELRQRIEWADCTIANSDLVNVSNEDDRAELIRRGIAAEKIVVQPFGIDLERRRLFDAAGSEPPARPCVVFVGTFDYRKGAMDLPRIFAQILAVVPAARFKLLGTRGLVRTADAVLRFFPQQLRSRIEVHPTFAAHQLPALLSDGSVGVFPSYYEGFGFGVLEMLAAAIPVIAYHAPGPPMMLDRASLVPPGDISGMASKVIELLRDDRLLRQRRIQARESSRRFDWDIIAKDTSTAYLQAIERRAGHNAEVPR